MDDLFSNDIYGEHRLRMEAELARLTRRVRMLGENMGDQSEFNPIEHVRSRMKSNASMREKCRRKGFPETTESALNYIYDALGIRIVCAFLSDVYTVRDHIAADPESEVVEERDYIRHAKPNGYRSYHMILRSREGYYVEVQIRTISMDTWAALEHHLHYKKAHEGDKNDDSQRLIVAELKRCADELASTDVSLQTLRDIILGSNEEDGR